MINTTNIQDNNSAENAETTLINKENKVKIHFKGGAITPTGSNFLLEVGDKNFLVDCGLYQGGRESHTLNRKEFSYDVKQIDAMFITHAHLDHVGRKPILTKSWL